MSARGSAISLALTVRAAWFVAQTRLAWAQQAPPDPALAPDLGVARVPALAVAQVRERLNASLPWPQLTPRQAQHRVVQQLVGRSRATACHRQPPTTAAQHQGHDVNCDIVQLVRRSSNGAHASWGRVSATRSEAARLAVIWVALRNDALGDLALSFVTQLFGMWLLGFLVVLACVLVSVRPTPTPSGMALASG
jgi:hypothetical protein